MSQSSSDKYVYFTIGVLKDSQTLEALRQDAIKHHMVDHPGQLIALRLAEYYEMMHNVTVQPVMRVPVATEKTEMDERERSLHSTAPHPIHLTPAPPSAASQAPTPINAPVRSFTPTPIPTHPNPSNPYSNQNTGRMRALRPESESIISTSPNADQNADEAADYWNAL